MKYNFDILTARKHTDSIKYSDPRDNILPMWVADMDFEVLPEIKEAVKSRADLASYGYVDVDKEYFKAYISWFKRHHHFEIKEECCMFATGVVAAIDSIFKHVFSKNDKVMMQTPIYHTFFHCFSNNQIELVENPLKYDNYSYSIDWDNLENNLKSGDIKGFLLCNPHNPTGLSFSKEDLNHIARLCYENHVLLISDEVHGDIAEPGYEYTSCQNIDEKYLNNVITLYSPSKAFNVASIHAAMVVVNDPLLKDKIQAGLWSDDVGEPSYFACPVAIAAYNNGDLWNKELCKYIQINKDYVSNYINEKIPTLKVVKSHFMYLMWIDISTLHIDNLDFSNRLKEEAGIWVSLGHQFHGNGDNFIRVNVATSLDNIKEFCLRLEKFINNLI